jgi:hypothetical protein
MYFKFAHYEAQLLHFNFLIKFSRCLFTRDVTKSHTEPVLQNDTAQVMSPKQAQIGLV